MQGLQVGLNAGSDSGNAARPTRQYVTGFQRETSNFL